MLFHNRIVSKEKTMTAAPSFLTITSEVCVRCGSHYFVLTLHNGSKESVLLDPRALEPMNVNSYFTVITNSYPRQSLDLWHPVVELSPEFVTIATGASFRHEFPLTNYF